MDALERQLFALGARIRHSHLPSANSKPIMKTTLSILFAAAVCLLVAMAITGCTPAHAQDVPVAASTNTVPDAGVPQVSAGTTDAIANFIAPLVAKYPWLAMIITVLGGARLLIKPLFTFLHSVVMVTPTTKDDEFLAKTESSKAYKWAVWVLDYVFSIKLIHPKATA